MARQLPVVLADAMWPDPAIHQGIAEVAEREGWQVLFLDHRGGRYHLDAFEHFDGVIGMYNQRQPQAFERLARWNCPLVNMSPAQPPGIPVAVANVSHDGQAIGAAGARHLIDEGHRHLAFLRQGNGIHELQRLAGFRAVAERRGLRTIELRCNRIGQRADDLVARLAELPRPLAVMCENDDTAIALCAILHRAGLAIPEDVAVLGVDDDPLLCLHCRPPLASVQTDVRQVARRAAETLAMMMAGREVPPMTLLPPVGVAARESSRYVVVDHEAVLNSLAFIATQAPAGITAQDVVDASGLSRSALYRAFAKHRRRSVAEEIAHQRLERAATLLTTTRRPQVAIAQECGFRSPEVFLRAFKRRYGLTPGHYRRHAHGD